MLAWYLGWEDALEKGMATRSSVLARRVWWTEELDGLQSMGCKESDMTEQLSSSSIIFFKDRDGETDKNVSTLKFSCGNQSHPDPEMQLIDKFMYSFIPSSSGGFPGGTSGNKTACQCKRHKRPGFNLWVGRSLGGSHGNPLQYSCLENPMDRGAWQATVHRVAKSWTRLKQLCMHGMLLHSFKMLV